MPDAVRARKFAVRFEPPAFILDYEDVARGKRRLRTVSRWPVE